MAEVELRDGLRLQLRRAGHGPTLLLAHGFTGCGQAWGDALLRDLASDFSLLVIDMLGHGASSKPRDPRRYALAEQVADLCQVLDAAGVERAIWVGYSMGGRVSLGAAVQRPDRVRALVLEGASPGLADAAERSARVSSDEALARRLETESLVDFVDAWMDLPLFASQRHLDPALLSQERRRRLDNNPGALAASLRGLSTGAQPSLWQDLHRVRMPVLLVSGSEDPKFGAIADAMLERLPGAERLVVPGSGHTTHLENPGALARSVRLFCRRVLRGAES